MSASSTTATASAPATTALRRSRGFRAGMAIAVVAVVALGVAIGLAVWGPSSSSASATSQVRANWVTFFKGSSPTATRVALLQHGAEARGILAAAAGSGFARGLSATVTKVTITSPTTAAVTYAIAIGGVPLLADQHGTAVKVGTVWQVSTQSFCSLLALEHLRPAFCT